MNTFEKPQASTSLNPLSDLKQSYSYSFMEDFMKPKLLVNKREIIKKNKQKRIKKKHVDFNISEEDLSKIFNENLCVDINSKNVQSDYEHFEN